MRVISTVICLFAAFIMMATPVMACCVTGHVDMSADSVQMADASAPPCHTPAEAKSGDSDTQTPEKYCPSCDDCAVSSVFMADSDPVTHAKTDLTFVTLLNTPAALPRPEVRLLRKTGPPPRQVHGRLDSPYLRFDTQLI
jgi:hypothetical protein